MTFRKLLRILGQLLALGLLIATNLVMTLRRSAEARTGWLELFTDGFRDPLLPACALLVMLLPPLWLAWNFPKLRARLGGTLSTLLIANGFGLALLLFVPLAEMPSDNEPVPQVSPTPKVVVPIRPTRKTLVWLEPTLRPTPSVSVTPVVTKKPEQPQPKSKPTERPTPQPRPDSKPSPVEKADRSPFGAIDHHALATPTSKEVDIPTLARYLTQPTKNETEKIRAIHRWVSDRISYDAKSFFAGDYPDQSAENTLRTRKSVCAGYANLVHALGQAAGLKTEVISGFAPDFGSDKEFGKNESHAWNAVKIDGSWKLLDATWSAGHIDDKQKFEKRYTDFYFMPEPKALGNTHWPSDPKWQLVETPLTLEQFRNQARLFPAFSAEELRLAPDTNGRLTADPVTTVSLEVPDHLHLMAILRDQRGKDYERATVITRQGSQATISVKAPKAGAYVLTLYCGAYEAEESEAVAEFTVTATSGNREGYPILASALQRQQGRVLEPEAGTLFAGTQTFDLEVPGAAAVYVNGYDTQLEKSGDRFHGTIPVTTGQVHLFAQFDKPELEPVASFHVRPR